MSRLDVLCVGTIGSVMRELVPVFTRETGIDVASAFGNPAATADRVRDGVPADLAIVANGVWEMFAALPRANPQDRRELCRTVFAAALKPGASRADIASMASLRNVLATIGSLGLVARSASTPRLQAGFEALGLADELARKTHLFPTGEAVAEALAQGEVDLGITTTSELLSVPNLVILDPLPPEIAPADTISTASVLRDAANPEAARRFLAFLGSPQAQAVFAAKGHRPI